MQRIARVAVALAAVACACHRERTEVQQGPPLLVPPGSAQPPATAAAPVEAKFVDVGAKAQAIAAGPCQQIFVAMVQGTARAGGDDLGAGDVLAVRAGPGVQLQGEGVAVVATANLAPCDASEAPANRSVLRGAKTPELTFMGGTMHAHLDVDDRGVAPSLYLGRLDGTAGVPEHVHVDQWELLCAVQASGVFTLAGQDRRLGPRTCVAVPPNTKHSWKPDPGSDLVAVQIYAPPGPEQRFKKLAAEDAARDR